MKVVVLMSSYNGEKYIREQIESILNQKGDFEIDLVVRDDGSQDKTTEILDEYKKLGLLTWYSGTKLGPSKSFLSLIKENLDYDFFALSDQDDFWLSNKIQKAVHSLSNVRQPAVYFSNAELVDEKLQSLGRNVYRETPKTDLYTLSCAGGILGCTVVFNRSLAKYLQFYPTPNEVVMHDFYISLLCASLNGKIIFDSTSTMKYRQHTSNVVGVSYGKIGTIIGRIKDIFYKEPVGIAKQSKEIIDIYKKDLPDDSVKWLTKIQNYDLNIINRIKLAFSSNTRYINKNMGLKLRLSILFGNR